MTEVKLIECPRDAMQGIHEFIPTEVKVNYLNGLLRVGYDTIYIGSFVSPKAIHHMAATPLVLQRLALTTRHGDTFDADWDPPCTLVPLLGRRGWPTDDPGEN